MSDIPADLKNLRTGFWLPTELEHESWIRLGANAQVKLIQLVFTTCRFTDTATISNTVH
jgi:hypothetical protein